MSPPNPPPPGAIPEGEDVATKPTTISFNFQTIVFVIIILTTFYVARGFLLPVFAALLLSYALIPVVRLFMMARIPRIVASLLVVAVFTAAILYGSYAFLTLAVEWVEKAPESLSRLQERISQMQGPMQSVSAATAQLEELRKGQEEGQEIVVSVKQESLVEIAMSQTPLLIGGVVSTLILMFFLLSFGQILLKRVVEISPRLRDKRRAVDTAREVEWSVSTYLVTVTLINIGLGVCIGGALFALGSEDAILWGVMAALLNFIPYLGSVAGVALLAITALGSANSIGEALIYPGVYFAFTVIEGNFVTPLILGRSFMINPIFIVLFLLFFGWLWGIPGAIMAVPILIAVKCAAAQFESTQPLAQILAR